MRDHDSLTAPSAMIKYVTHSVTTEASKSKIQDNKIKNVTLFYIHCSQLMVVGTEISQTWPCTTEPTVIGASDNFEQQVYKIKSSAHVRMYIHLCVHARQACCHGD